MDSELKELISYKEKLDSLISENSKKLTTENLNEGQAQLLHKQLEKLEIRLTEIKKKLSSRVKKPETYDEEIEKLTTTFVNLDLLQCQLEMLFENEKVKKEEKSELNNSFVKVDKLRIGNFNGDIFKFYEFWDQFDVSIHQNNFISIIDKFKLLKSYLEGKASDKLAGINITVENYQTAVDILQNEYGNKQILIEKHYIELKNLPKSNNYSPNLRKTIDSIEKHVRCLENFGESTEQRLFITIIKEKFPAKFILEVEKVEPIDSIKAKKLIENIKKIVSTQERVYTLENDKTSAGTSTTTGERTHYGQDQGKPNFTTASLLTASNYNNYKNMIMKCVYCSKEHWSDECKAYPTLESRKEKIKGGCFICLSKRHLLKDCPIDKPCFHCKVPKNHHRSLCPKSFKQTENNKIAEESSLMAINEEVIMQTATLYILNPSTQQKFLTRLLLDSGSQRTYITENLRKRANLKGDDEQILSVFTFGNTAPKQMKTKLANLTIEFTDSTTFDMKVNIVPEISGKLSGSKHQLISSEKIQGLSLADKNVELPIEMLVGNDYYHEIVLNEKREILPGLYLINSKLGWIITGRYDQEKPPSEVMSLMTYSKNEISTSTNEINILTPLDDDVKKLWDLDVIGIRENPEINGDDIAVKTFNESIKFEDGRYVVSWPWKEFPPKLSNCYPLAFGRLKSLMNSLKSKNILLQYDEIIQDQLNKGIVEIVPQNEINVPVKHYLPHHPVITPQKETTKIRIVFDGSAKLKKSENSLNECLYRGQNMIEYLPGLLIRFRTHPYVVLADIEKAYLQLGLHKVDRDAARFLWLKDIFQPVTPENLLILRFARVLFGIISSSWLLNAVIRHHLQSISNNDSIQLTLILKNAATRIAKLIAKNMYADNVVIGLFDENEAVILYEVAKEIFSLINMNLRQWITNSSMLKNKLPSPTQPTETTVLGINWNLTTDKISIKIEVDLQHFECVTKRTLVKIVASVFDPLGLICPVLLQPKVLIQYLWQQKYEWDDVIADKDVESWPNIRENLAAIKTISIPRNILTSADSIFELHCFTDASKHAYAATLYLREITGSVYKNNLLFAKLRLAPPKVTTIPRLELLGVLIGIRCIRFITKQLNLKLEQIYLWTDSQCVLHWIKSNRILPIFVENRLKEIKSEKNVIFKYVPTADNPADWATRGKLVSELDSFWWNGPTWLSQSNVEWPSCQLPDINSTPEEETQIEFATLFNETSQPVPPFGLNSTNYSSLKKLLQITSYCLKFIHKIRRQASTSDEEISQATVMWERHIQLKYYENIISDISEGKSNLLKLQLGLELDNNGILRCKGRIQNAFNDDSLFPKLLPGNDHFTKLVVLDTHVKLFHVGVSHTLAEVRKHYWIPKGRSTIRQILKYCPNCIRFSVGPYKLPNMAPLPLARVTESLPFLYTGLDYLGPLYVKPNHHKIWICLFTCFTTRAIHLEMASGLDSEEFLLALRRFIARRRKPKHITSDNAKQFKLTSTLLPEINWHFIPELAPWHGGFYERLVAMVKNCLKKTLLKRTLFETQLYTIITEIEATLNSRPLIYVGDDIESNNFLSPAHFLSLHAIQTIGNFEDDDYADANYHPTYSTRTKLENNWSKGQGYLNAFWKMWREEYLTSLMERNITKIKQPRVTSQVVPREGDIVLVADNLPRAQWRLGKVVNLNISRDNAIRSAALRLPNGQLVTRPLNLLYPLEINDGSSASPNIPSNSKNGTDLSTPSTEKPRRKAAEIAKQKITHLYNRELV